MSADSGGEPSRVARTREGMQAYAHHMRDTRTFNLLVLIRLGSRDETQGIYGGAHHLEHLLFKGTSAFTKSKRLTALLDQVGAAYNASTHHDHTRYYITLPSDHAELAYAVLSDMMLYPLLRRKDVEKEKGVVLEEIHRLRDNPSAYVMDLLYARVFDGNSLARPIAGELTDVAQHDPVQIRKLWAQYYVPDNMCLVATGNLPGCTDAAHFTRRALRLANYYFSRSATRVTPRVQALRAKLDAILRKLQTRPDLAVERTLFQATQQRTPRIHFHRRDVEQCHTTIAFPTAFGYRDPRRYPTILLAKALGGYMSSRLWGIVREENGWAYGVHVEFHAMEDTGCFLVHMGLKTQENGREDPDITRKAIATTLQELARVRARGLRPEELRDARGFTIGQLLMNSEKSSWVSAHYAQYLLYHHLGQAGAAEGEPPMPPLTIEQEVQAFQRVDLDALHAASHEILDPSRCSLVFLGKTDHTIEQLRQHASSIFVHHKWDRNTIQQPPPPIPTQIQ